MAIKLTPAALRLLEAIHRGQVAVFWLTDRPNGWSQLEHAGLAVRDTANNANAVLTTAGREYVRQHLPPR